MKYKAFLLIAITLVALLVPLSAAAEETCTHEYGEWVLTVAPTCTQKGEVTRTCALCGEAETATVAQTAHSESDWTLGAAPDVGVAGSMQKTCTVCGAVLATQELAALPEPEPDNTEEIQGSTEQEQPWIEITLPVAIGICLVPNAVLVVALLIRKIRRKIASKYFD